MNKTYIKFIILGLSGFLVFCMFGGNCFSEQAPVTPPAAPLQAQVQAPAVGNKISLDLKGMDIVDVLKMLALRSGKNIVAGKNVRGKITIYLKDVDVMDALEIILISNELAYDMKGDIINVMSDRDYEALYGEKFQDKTKLRVIKLKYGKAAEASKALNQLKSRVGKIVVDDISNTIVIMDAPQVVAQMEQLLQNMDLPTSTKVFALNYSKAETMQKKIEPLLTKGIGTIQLDERTNKIIVTDITGNMKAIENAVAEFDEKTKEVLIDSKILQITLNDEYKAGINWDAVFDGIKTQLGMNFNVITGTPIPTTAAGAVTGGGIHVGGLDTKYNAEAMIKFLKTYGKANLLASPRIVTINNEEAKILVGTNQPYATSTTTTPGTGSSVTSYQITFLDLGVKLYVTPTINRDGYITMKIKPEVSSTSTDYKYGANQDTVPIVKTSQAETTVMIKDGSTIVIAGLIENRQEETINKVPGIGDAPLVGSLFRNRTTGSSTNPEKNELVIFLTPHIISGDATSPEVDAYAGLTGKLEKQLMQKEIKDLSEKPQEDLLKEELAADRTRHPFSSIKKGGSENKIKEAAAPKAEAAVVKEEPKEVTRKEITRDEYYGMVRKKIFEKVRENYPSESLKGEVYLSFRIARDGSLKDSPKLLKPVDQALKELAVSSVRDAAPFEPFPKNFTRSEEVFSIAIVYE